MERGDEHGGQLEQLEHYPAQDVEELMARLSAAVGDEHARDYDVGWHLLDVACTVLRARDGVLAHELAPRLEASDQLVWLFDEDERVVWASARAAASLGYTPAEVIGRPNAMFRAPGQDWTPHRHELEATGESEGVTLARHKDGRTATVEHRARALRVAGRVAFLVQTKVVALVSLGLLGLLLVELLDLLVPGGDLGIGAALR